MERNAIIATALVIVILLGYQWYLSRYEATQPEAPSSAGKAAPPAAPTPGPPAATAPAPTPAPRASMVSPVKPQGYTPTAQVVSSPKEVVVDTPLVHAVFTTAGARAKSWQLKHYRMDNGSPVDLVGAPDTTGPGALAAWADPEQIDGLYQVDVTGLELTAEKPTGVLTFSQVSASGVQLEKQLTFEATKYQVAVVVRIRNLAAAGDAPLETRLAWGPGLRNGHDKRNALQSPTFWLDGKRHQEDIAKLPGEKALGGQVAWAAVQDSYFAAALLPKEAGLQAFVQKGPHDQPIIGLATAKQGLAPGGQAALRAQFFAGPRDVDVLKSVGQDLDQLVDLGWFAFLARPALWLLKLLYGFIGNYGVAIIVVTILQKVAFYPLTTKSMKSMQAMQALQPKVAALQERFKNNPQKKQEETMALYRKYGVNPMGGCLPMLVQIPIFIALYNALSSSVEMWQAHFLWIRDLTQPDSLFTMRLWGPEPYNVGNLLGLLMGISMFVQQKMSPTTGDPRQAQMMLWLMPILFTFMFWNFPSGLVLYWFVNNLLQVGQQWLINRKPSRPAAPDPQPV